MAFGLAATAHLPACATSRFRPTDLSAHASDQQRHLRHGAAVPGLERGLSLVLPQPLERTRLIRSHLRSLGGVAAFRSGAGGGGFRRYALQKDRTAHPWRYLRPRSPVAALSCESVPRAALRASLGTGARQAIPGPGARPAGTL